MAIPCLLYLFMRLDEIWQIKNINDTKELSIKFWSAVAVTLITYTGILNLH